MSVINRDLTVGEPRQVLWRFCLPLFGSVIFQQMYNLTDSLVAGKFIGENALAAVGNSYEITLIFLAFAVGCSMGCSVVVSTFFGAKEYRDMKTAVYTAMISAGVTCAVLMAASTLWRVWLLKMIRTPDEIFADSKLYLDIYVWGLPFMFFYNLATGVFSALGDSKTPFFFLAASSLSNIFVDILFVTAFRMGVAGVAWATFLCQSVSCVLAVTVVARRLREIEVKEPIPMFSKPIFVRFLRIAVPSVFQQGYISIGNIVLQSVINGFGAAVIAGYSAAVKLNNLVITSFSTIGSGMSNYTAQNLGAGRLDRAAAGFGAGVRIVWTVGLPFALAYFFGGRLLLGLFMTDPSPEAMSTGITLLRILSPFYLAVSVKIVSDGILRGAAKMLQFMSSSMLSLTIRVAGAELLSRTALGSTGIWIAWPIGWVISMALSVWFLHSVIKTEKEIRLRSN